MNTSNLLIVDDEHQVGEMIAEVLRTRIGCNTFTAINGDDAMKLLKKNHINIIILDLNLVNETGIDICRRIKDRNPIAYVIACTGQRRLFEVTDCRAAGFDDYFTKPVDFDEMIKTVQFAERRMRSWVGLKEKR